ncbi:MAG: WD40 repeat domain-containing protein [Sphingomonadaceae bacterium]
MISLRAALFAASLLVPASALARPMTPEDVARIEQVGAIAVSPDGTRVAHTTAWLPDVTKGKENGSTKQQLRVSWGAEEVRDFLPRDMSVSDVGFSPDGRMISFTWTADKEKRGVWGIPLDGGAQHKLAGIDDVGISEYAWAPDGQTLYLIASAAPDKSREKAEKAGFDAEVYEEEQRPNRLFAARVSDKVDENPRQIPVTGHITSLIITPDGKRAIAEIAPTTLVDDSYMKKRVSVLDLASGNVIRQVTTPGKLGDVEMSPDGNTLSMVAGVDQHDPGATTLYLVDTASGAYRPVNEGAPEAVIDTDWTDQGQLVAVVHTGARSLLRLYDASGKQLQQFDPGDLSLGEVDARGGKIMVEASSPSHPTELFMFDNGQFTRWTRHNPWLADIDFGKQSIIRYPARVVQ